MIRICSECGKPYDSNVASKLTCSKECSEARRLKRVAEKNARERAATRERLGVKICATCGKEFAPSHSTKVCCSPACQKERERQMAKVGWLNVKQTKAKKPKSNQERITDINTKAKAMGLSYGQYVARYGG